MAVVIGLVVFVLPLPGFFRLPSRCSGRRICVGTQDIAADAVYLTTLPQKDQAKWMVFRICWNCGSLLATGPLVVVTGKLHDSYGYDWTHAWMVVIGLLAGVMLLFACGTPGHCGGEPRPCTAAGCGGWKALDKTWITFFQRRVFG